MLTRRPAGPGVVPGTPVDPYLWAADLASGSERPEEGRSLVKQLGLQAPPGQHSAQASAQLQRPEGNDTFFQVSRWTRTDGWAAPRHSQRSAAFSSVAAQGRQDCGQPSSLLREPITCCSLQSGMQGSAEPGGPQEELEEQDGGKGCMCYAEQWLGARGVGS